MLTFVLVRSRDKKSRDNYFRLSIQFDSLVSFCLPKFLHRTSIPVIFFILKMFVKQCKIVLNYLQNSRKKISESSVYYQCIIKLRTTNVPKIEESKSL